MIVGVAESVELKVGLLPFAIVTAGLDSGYQGVERNGGVRGGEVGDGGAEFQAAVAAVGVGCVGGEEEEEKDE